jgi:hypothetical protein
MKFGWADQSKEPRKGTGGVHGEVFNIEFPNVLCMCVDGSSLLL